MIKDTEKSALLTEIEYSAINRNTMRTDSGKMSRQYGASHSKGADEHPLTDCTTQSHT